MKFPNTIHVIREEPERDKPYLVVHEDGVQSIKEDGTVVAIYQLVKVGKARIHRSFEDVKAKR